MASKIQSIVFKKSKWNVKEATKWLKDNNFKYNKLDEKKASLRFRQRNKNKIYNYRTIKLTDGVQAVIMFKTEHMSGGMSLSSIFPPSVNSTMERHGDKIIKNITVCRKPLAGAIEKVANFFTMGKYEEAKKLLHYDKMYHLGMQIELEDGTPILAEKNQVVNVKEGTFNNPTNEMPVPKIHTKQITLNELFTKAVDQYGSDYIWNYDVVNANCQRFVTSLLVASGLDYPRLRVFVNQNVKAALESDGLQKVVKFITNSAAKFSILKQKLFG
jgi:superfamily II DNA/RNA helicase